MSTVAYSMGKLHDSLVIQHLGSLYQAYNASGKAEQFFFQPPWSACPLGPEAAQLLTLGRRLTFVWCLHFSLRAPRRLQSITQVSLPCPYPKWRVYKERRCMIHFGMEKGPYQGEIIPYFDVLTLFPFCASLLFSSTCLLLLQQLSSFPRIKCCTLKFGA